MSQVGQGIRLATGGGILDLVSSHLLDGGVSALLIAVVGVERWVKADAPLSSLHEGRQAVTTVGLLLCQGVRQVVVRRQPKFRADGLETVSKLKGLERCPKVAQT